MRAGVTLLTRELAEALVKLNSENVPLRESKLKWYHQQMRDGLWRETGEAFIIGRSGRLLNGQHRLMAFLRTDLPSLGEIVLVQDVDDSNFAAMDTGRPRTLDQVLSKQGEKVHVKTLASVVRSLYSYELVGIPISGGVLGSQKVPNTETLLRFLEERPTIRDSVSFARTTRYRVKGLTETAVGTLHYIITRNGAFKLATSFFSGLHSGENLAADDPRFALRERLMKDVTSNARLSPRAKMSLAIQAWNAYVTGTPRVKLGWDPDRPFPRVLVPEKE